MSDEQPTQEPMAPEEHPPVDSEESTSVTTDKPLLKNEWGRLQKGLPIIEAGVSEHPGDLHLPTYGAASVKGFELNLETWLQSLQAARGEEADQARKEGRSAPYLDLRSFQTQVNESDSASFWITENELQLLIGLQATQRAIYQCSQEPLRDDLQHLYTHDHKGSKSPIGILKVTEEGTTDPVLKIEIGLGLSVPRLIPLWNSGFRVQLDTPETWDLLNLETEMTTAQIDQSMASMGYSLSSTNVEMDVALINFILKHVLKTTADTDDPKLLKHRIRLTDYHSLVLGQAVTLYPNGYSMVRTVYKTNEDGSIREERVKRRINPTRMHVTRTSRFADWQKDRMAKTVGRCGDVKTLLEYQKAVRPEVSRFVDIHDKYIIELYVPTLADYERIGSGWQDRMRRVAQEVLGTTASPEERAHYIARAANISAVMYLAHWVKGFWYQGTDEAPSRPVDGLVRLDPLESTMEEVDATDMKVDTLLRRISSDYDKAQRLIDAINKFQDEMNLSFAIVPREPGTSAPKGEHPRAVIVNPVEIFFTQLRHKILEGGG